jgi:hypothetical protein
LRSVPLPTSEQEYEDAEAAAGNLRKAFDALDLAAALPQDVVELFRAASYRGAPIHLLTPEVLAWLKKHNMEDSVCIVLSRNR